MDSTKKKIVAVVAVIVALLLMFAGFTIRSNMEDSDATNKVDSNKSATVNNNNPGTTKTGDANDGPDQLNPNPPKEDPNAPKLDVCPKGDYTSNNYDGKCGNVNTPPKNTDNCPKGDNSISRYDGTCGKITFTPPPVEKEKCPEGQTWHDAYEVRGHQFPAACGQNFNGG